MLSRHKIGLELAIVALIAFGSVAGNGAAQEPASNFSPDIPKAWDDDAITSLEIPLAEPEASAVHVSSDYYYRIPVRTIYKSYPVYAPGREPAVGTDSDLALKSRKGTGYYKIPSLRGVWYRGPFEHNGSVATLDDWFDPARTSENYVPTGFIGFGVKTRAVKGHPFGLKLSVQDRKALIAFLKTL